MPLDFMPRKPPGDQTLPERNLQHEFESPGRAGVDVDGAAAILDSESDSTPHTPQSAVKMALKTQDGSSQVKLFHSEFAVDIR